MRHVLLGAALLVGCGDNRPDPSLAYLGGDTTIFDDGDEAFNYPLRNLRQELRGPFQIGDGVFNRNWVTAPATPQGSDGLGPTYNALSCSGCHSNNGRGAPPSHDGEPFLGLLLRVSVPGTDEHGGPMPDPSYGGQINQRAILGVSAEAMPLVTYTESEGRYADGTAYSLRVPTYSFASLSFGPLGAGAMISPRVAPQMIGLGLLEAVSEDTVLAFAQANGGRPNYVWNVATQKAELGRFGWKANQPNLEQQTFAAFLGDIGITSMMFPTDNCPPVQTACAAAPPSLTEPNLEPIKADAMVVHALGLAVPARRNLDDPQAQRGEQLFNTIGCASCHIPELDTSALEGWPELSNQHIRPFTDLLLHDMGPDLADNRPDFLATGAEWRTPPLWGLGLVESINGGLFLLHDGRARGFAEAILWHGGAGQRARDAFRALPARDRDAVVAFLQSL